MPHIDELPDEILEYILSNLPPYRDLEYCKNVSLRWANIVDNVLRHTKLSLNKGLLDYNLCWKNHVISVKNSKICPAPRYSHTSVVIGELGKFFKTKRKCFTANFTTILFICREHYVCIWWLECWWSV